MLTTRTKPAVEGRANTIQCFRGRIDRNSPNAALGILIGTLPPGALLLPVQVMITLPFNAVTTNVLTVGTLANPSLLVAAGDVDEAVIGNTQVPAKALFIGTPQEIYLFYSFTGTAPTQGGADVLVSYASPIS